LPFQGRADFPLAARTELQRNALSGTIAKPAADVIPADHEILAIFGAAANQNMDMRIVCVPVVDRDPIQSGSEITRDIGHQFTCKGAEIAELGGVLWRDDEAEVMPVILATLDESALIRCIRCRIEHPGVCA